MNLANADIAATHQAVQPGILISSGRAARGTFFLAVKRPGVAFSSGLVARATFFSLAGPVVRCASSSVSY